MGDSRAPAKDPLRVLLARRANDLAADALNDGGQVPAERLDALARLARLADLRDAATVAPPRRWPTVAVVLVTLVGVSVLIFARLRSTEVELDLHVSELSFVVPAEQVITDAMNVEALGLDGLSAVELPSPHPGPGTLQRATALRLSVDRTGPQPGTASLSPIAVRPRTRISLGRTQSPGQYRLGIRGTVSDLAASLQGPVRIVLPPAVNEVRDFPIPRRVGLEPDSEAVTLDFVSGERAGVAQPFRSPVPAESLSLFRVDQFQTAGGTLAPWVSTIQSGTVFFEEIDGHARPLRAGEGLSLSRSQGEIRELRLSDSGLTVRFHGEVRGMSVGTGEARRSLMPTYFEWLSARHALALLWAATGTVVSLFLTLTGWWKRTVPGLWLCVLSAAYPLAAQTPAKQGAEGGNVPDVAKAMVVSVTTVFGDSTPGQYGAGIIVGVDGSGLYVATAGHVVQGAPEILVGFGPRDTMPATVVVPGRRDFDLAVLRVAADPAQRRKWTPPSWDRIGNVRALRSDDPVSPVGCPQHVCWEAPAPADRVVGKDPLGILFQSYFVGPGSSGGALFNQWWEVVGMVTHDEPPRGEALRIDEVLARVEAAKLPVNLARPSVPRAGYATSLGLAVLMSTSSSSADYESRTPSGRVTLERQVLPAVSWHLSALRLAPENLAVTAGMGGVGLRQARGRFSGRLFVEAGFGRVEGRRDLGGYHIAGPGGVDQYVPLWNRETADGLGIGGGATLAAIAFPRTIVEITAGYWSFTMPENVESLKKVFFGGGVRLGL